MREQLEAFVEESAQVGGLALCAAEDVDRNVAQQFVVVLHMETHGDDIYDEQTVHIHRAHEHTHTGS